MKPIVMDIKSVRENQLGITQTQLAALLDVSLRSVQNYEGSGKIPAKKYKRLQEILLNQESINQPTADKPKQNTPDMELTKDEIWRILIENIRLKEENEELKRGIQPAKKVPGG